MKKTYEDIIYLTHPTSLKHPRMTQLERAAQFSPFAALSGYQKAIDETARICDKKRALSEDQIQFINQKLQILQLHMKEHPFITITYFQADQRKDGGAYITVQESCKKIDVHKQVLQLENNVQIAFLDIYEIASPLFYELDQER